MREAATNSLLIVLRCSVSQLAAAEVVTKPIQAGVIAERLCDAKQQHDELPVGWWSV